MLNQEEKPSIWTRWFRSENKRKVTILMEPKLVVRESSLKSGDTSLLTERRLSPGG